MNANKRSALILAALTSSIVLSAVAVTYSRPAPNKWAEVDAFKVQLPVKLDSSYSNPNGFDIQGLATDLHEIRVDGMEVCALEEISADQYIRLSEIADAVSGNAQVTIQLNRILDTPEGVTDCQYRVLNAAVPSNQNTDQ